MNAFNAGSLMSAIYHLCEEDDLGQVIVRVLDESSQIYGDLLTVQGEVSPDGSATITLVVGIEY